MPFRTWLGHIPLGILDKAETKKDFENDLNYIVDKTLEMFGENMDRCSKIKLKNCKKRCAELTEEDYEYPFTKFNRILNTIYDVGDYESLFFDFWDYDRNNFKVLF